MTPFEWVVAGLSAGLLLLAYRLVDGLLKAKADERRGQKVKAQTLGRLEHLEALLSRIPTKVPSEEELEEVRVTAERAKQSAEAAKQALLDESAKLARILITREAAEKIVNQVNAVTLDVEALKDWQRGLDNADALEGVLDPTKEKTA